MIVFHKTKHKTYVKLFFFTYLVKRFVSSGRVQSREWSIL